MAIRHTPKGRETRSRRKESHCQKVLHIHPSDLKSVDDQNTQTHIRDTFQPKAVLFINHYAAKGAHEVHRPDRSTVGSHVQRVIRHNKRVNAEFRLRPAILREIRSGYHVGRVRINERPSVQSRMSSQISANGNAISNPEATPRRLAVEESPLKQDSPDNIETTTWARLQSLNLNQTHSTPDLGGVGVQARTPRSSVARTIFQYYQERFVARLFPVDSQKTEHLQWVVQCTLVEDGFLFAILALGASVPDTVPDISIDCSKSMKPDVLVTTHHTITLVIKAIVWLHAAINCGQNSGWMTIAYGVACLILIETVEENIEAIRQHSSALQHLISSAKSEGGKATPTHIMHVIMSTYYFSCFVGGDCPVYPSMLRHREEALCAEMSNTESKPRRLGQNCFNPCLHSVLGSDLKQNFLDIRAFIIWRERHILDKQQLTAADSEFFHLRYWRAQYLALCHPFKSHAKSPNCLEEPFRLAMLVFWTADTQIHLPGSILYQKLASQLASALKEPVSSPQLWQDFHELFLWILLLGAFITEGQSENHWFVMNIVRGLKYSGGNVLTWEQVESSVARFLYVDRVFERGFKSTWTRVVRLASDRT